MTEPKTSEIEVMLTDRLTTEEILDTERNVQALLEQEYIEYSCFERETTRFLERIRDLRKDINHLSKIISSGIAVKSVPCRRELDVKNHKVRVHRIDTGEAVMERDMSEEEIKMLEGE